MCIIAQTKLKIRSLSLKKMFHFNRPVLVCILAPSDIARVQYSALESAELDFTSAAHNLVLCPSLKTQHTRSSTACYTPSH